MIFPAMPIIMLMEEDMNECSKNSASLTVKFHSRPGCILP